MRQMLLGQERKEDNDTAAPFFPPHDPPHQPPGLRVPVSNSRTKLAELSVKSILNSPESTGLGFWSLNPYVGCEFGCTYCYARYAHRYVVERAWTGDQITAQQFTDLSAPPGLEPFEHRIFVKSRGTVLSALERDLPRLRRRTARDGPQSVLVGTATDPYQPAERQYQITRAVLTRLLEDRGFRIGIITKSPLVCRDLDLLKQLARQHSLSIYISVVAIDARVIRLFEARSPLPHARLKALSKLSAAGLRAGLIVAPILPGITDSTPQVRALIVAARDAGARFVFPSPLRFYPAVRQRFLPVVAEHFPNLVSRYHVAYQGTWDAPPAYRRSVQERFQRMAREYGIPDTDAERERPAARTGAAVSQLSLFGRSGRA